MQNQELNSQPLHVQATILSPELQCRLWAAVLALPNLWNPVLSPGKALFDGPSFPMEVARLGGTLLMLFFSSCAALMNVSMNIPGRPNNKPPQTLPSFPELPLLWIL